MYLAADIHRVADVDSRRRLRSASTAELLVPSTEHSTIGDRAFPMAAARAWNSAATCDFIAVAAGIQKLTEDRVG
jgi:hypothetical protein